jgi:hypothetical protein
MEHREKRGIRGRHVFGLALAIVMGLTNIWVIQLARNGEMVGYLLLALEIILATVVVVGLVISFAIGQAAKVSAAAGNSSGRSRSELKDLYDTMRLLNQQNKTLRQLLEEQGLGDPQLPAPHTLQPGQMMTADGTVIESKAFDVLDDDE